MNPTLKLTVVTPERSIVDGAACEEMTLPGAEGELGILPGHAALVTLLGAGTLSWRSGRESRTIAVRGGFAEIADDVVRVLADEASTRDGIDASTAKKNLAAAEKRRLDAEGDVALDAANADVAYAEAQLRIESAVN